MKPIRNSIRINVLHQLHAMVTENINFSGIYDVWSDIRNRIDIKTTQISNQIRFYSHQNKEEDE